MPPPPQWHRWNFQNYHKFFFGTEIRIHAGVHLPDLTTTMPILCCQSGTISFFAKKKKISKKFIHDKEKVSVPPNFQVVIKIHMIMTKKIIIFYQSYVSYPKRVYKWHVSKKNNVSKLTIFSPEMGPKTSFVCRNFRKIFKNFQKRDSKWFGHFGNSNLTFTS